MLYFNSQKIYIAVYINDLYIIGPDLSFINKLKMELIFKFKTTNLGLRSHYLDIEVFREDDTITVMQIVYINQLLNTYRISNYNPSSISIVEGINLVPISDDYLSNPNDISAYKQFIKSI